MRLKFFPRLSAAELAHQYARGIRERGFKKWHERELIHSHMDLISALLLLSLAMASLEWYTSTAHPLAKLGSMALVVVATGFSARYFMRYGERLFTAEALASQAVCPKCQAYAKLDLCGQQGASLRVRCRSCQTEWELESSD